jgi:hypothetical protein
MYNYCPLNINREEIRLMHLLPGARGSPCRCALSHVSLKDDDLWYTALSYAWGSLEDPRTVAVESLLGESGSISVTQNLYSALDYIRDTKKTRTLWIDAICIDQANIPERNYQVQRMRHIYRRAFQVLVWLGAELDDSALAMADVKEIAGWNKSRLRKQRSHNWPAIVALLQRPWFSRVWVRQEIWSAEVGTCNVRCGDAVLDITIFVEFYERLLRTNVSSSVPDDDPNIADLYGSISNIGFLVWCTPSNMQRLLPLEDCLKISAQAKATDPRDHLFAILGLTPWAEEASYLIDYSKSVAQVFSSVIILSLEKNGNLLLLEQKERFREDPRFPSWTPDWSCPAIHSRQTLESDLYQASKDSKVNFTISNCLQQLVLKGLEVSQVKAVESAVSADFNLIDFSEGRFLNDASLRQYRTKKGVLGALWRTMIADTKSVEGHYTRRNRLSKGDDYVKIRDYCQKKRQKGIEDFVNRPLCFSGSRRLLTSSHGHIALGATEVEEGDLICVFAGGNVPFIIRQKAGTRLYKYICEAYVHGIMDGEAWDEKKVECFTII